ncbi:MAG: hypothetical protein U0936_25275 [Planctomycetaceae bacterium]
MNEETHNSTIEPELEARIVALVLGEASDFETEELLRLIAARPELAEFVKEMQQVHELMASAALISRRALAPGVRILSRHPKWHFGSWKHQKQLEAAPENAMLFLRQFVAGDVE